MANPDSISTQPTEQSPYQGAAAEKRKTIIRVNHKALPYFMVARTVAQNEALSYEALGLLVYLLSKPDDWQVYPEALKRGGTGKSSVYRLIKELRAAGHIQRVVQRDDKKHITRFEYVVYEQPLPESERDLFPTNQEIGKLEVAKLEVGKPHHTEYRRVQSTEYTLAPEQSHANIVPFIPQPDGGARAYSLVEAWLDAWDIIEPRYRKGVHATQSKGAATLADMGATPDDITAMCVERRGKGKQPDEAKLAFLASDFVGWKSRTATTQPILVVETPEQVSAREAQREAERREWRKEQGLA